MTVFTEYTHNVVYKQTISRLAMDVDFSDYYLIKKDMILAYIYINQLIVIIYDPHCFILVHSQFKQRWHIFI